MTRVYQRWDDVLRRFLSVFLLLSVSLSQSFSFAQDCLTLSVHHTAGQPFCLLSTQPRTHPGFLLGPVDADIFGQPHTVTNCPQ